MLTYEKEFFEQGYHLIVGCDEAGRGPLAGPVVAAACILPSDYHNEDINDSKKLTDKKRRALLDEIENHAIAFGIGIVSAEKIDEINIYQASRLAMNMAIENMAHQFDLVLTDAMPLFGYDVPVIDIIKGDARAQCIAAASIIAKVTRDEMMESLDELYPQYGFDKHKGYGTKAHYQALDQFGPSPVHRLSFLKKYFAAKM
ncbi:MAG: ribonuclease HII [Coprobacillus sp.]|nr:ribonuclease HII [Coprobacillus sp.]